MLKNTIAKITVVIPCYNEKSYINECLDSVLAQEGVDLELIVVDDWSNDGTFELLEQRVKQDARIKLYRNEQNTGSPVAGRNLGIELAKGDWVAMVDADDKLLDDGFLQRIVAMMENSKADMGYCGFLSENPLRNYNPYVSYFEEHPREPLNFTQMNTGFWKSTPHSAAFKIYRRDFLLTNNLFFPNLIVEDQPFALLCFFLAHKICLDNSISYYYRYKKLDGKHRYNRYDFKNYEGNLDSIKWLLQKIKAHGLSITGMQEQLAIIMYRLFNVPDIYEEINFLVSHKMLSPISARKRVYEEMRAIFIELWQQFDGLEYKFFCNAEKEDIQDFLNLDFYEYIVARAGKNDLICREQISILAKINHELRGIGEDGEAGGSMQIRFLINEIKNIILGKNIVDKLKNAPRYIRYPLFAFFCFFKAPFVLYKVYTKQEFLSKNQHALAAGLKKIDYYSNRS